MKVGFGVDSHRFLEQTSAKKDGHKPLVLGGVCVDESIGVEAQSDGDALFHAITRALATLGARDILAFDAPELAKEGVLDSRVYLKKACESLEKTLPSYRISHISAVLEGARPRLQSHLLLMQENIALVCELAPESVGIVAHSGEGLSLVGQGLGIQASVMVTCVPR